MDFAKHVKVRPEKFGAVIFDTLNEKVYVTGQTGKEILGLLKEKRSLEDMLKTLGSKYGEEDTTIRKDVTDFVQDLKGKGLLR